MSTGRGSTNRDASLRYYSWLLYSQHLTNRKLFIDTLMVMEFEISTYATSVFTPVIDGVYSERPFELCLPLDTPLDPVM